MKTVYTTTMLLVLGLQLVNAQLVLNLKGTEQKTNKKVELKEIAYVEGLIRYQVTIDGAEKVVNYNEISRIDFEIKDLTDFWQNQAVKLGAYQNLMKYGIRYDLRRDWETEALQYLNKIDQNGLAFEDSYLESYLYSLIYRVYPGSLNDRRPGILNVKVMIDSSPNAFIFPNGTLVITTGLLSTLNSEEELLAVIAHEVSHFALDHSAINIHKAIQRQKNAEFWAGFATTLAAVTEVYVASTDEYYVPGGFTYNMAILSYSIANAFTERLGLKYSREQELEADNCAVELLKFLKVDHTALASALSKIREFCLLSGNYYALTGDGSHPNILERIKTIGTPNSFNSINYDKLVSLVNTSNAIIEFNSKHFLTCQMLVDRNIKAGVAIEDDYLLKAMTIQYMFDNTVKNNESLDLIRKAKSLKVTPSIHLHKQEALVLLRLKNFKEAEQALLTYNEDLQNSLNRIVDIRNEILWYNTKEYIDKEMTWAAKMLHKVRNL